ncbi:MAG: hypothetical protein QGF59_06930 [Pirellulaceae bacterium]|jgi:hypothetical protein|nr:hypothetical protein [Pirellulaceae bacterium]MDP6718367.1 hypothetical protein [Pirellulaceae bacterium]
MNNWNLKILLLSLASGLLVLSGCAQEGPATSTPSGLVTVDGSKYLLGSEPESASGVIKVRDEAKDQDDVVIVGRIGGSANPWIDGRAAFSIVDLSLKSCAECGSDDCPKPWDYC